MVLGIMMQVLKLTIRTLDHAGTSAYLRHGDKICRCLTNSIDNDECYTTLPFWYREYSWTGISTGRINFVVSLTIIHFYENT